ncbi:MAG: hypothetical protein IIC80_04530 [Chloroflexi bacterium]|nr:hypothetical protein [Chloroflexota bacterium]
MLGEAAAERRAQQSGAPGDDHGFSIEPWHGPSFREIPISPRERLEGATERAWSERWLSQSLSDISFSGLTFAAAQPPGPAMGGRDLNEWYRNFYPVFNRRGLILDVRHNNGGNIDSLILEKLMRKAWFYFKGRFGVPTWNQQYAFRGHMVVLCNENTSSDGEAFSEGFRRLGLGKVIGTRTWGGQIWLSGENTLADGGVASAAMFGVYGPEGKWLIEGHGVDPDMVVDNLPHESFNGADRQLDAAIKHLQELIEDDPRDVPPVPPHPDMSVK